MNNILVDLDSLFDTRLPMWFRLTKAETTKLYITGEYSKRLRDQIHPIPNNVFKAFYKRRDKRIMTEALPTYMFRIILETYIELRHDLLNAEIVEDMKIFINTYPYDFTADEQAKLLLYLSGTFGIEKIEIVNRSLRELSPDWISENEIGYVFMYNGLEWLEHQICNPKIADYPLINTALFVPALLTGHRIRSIKDDFFTKLKEELSSVCDLYTVDVKYYSGIIRKEEEKKETM